MFQRLSPAFFHLAPLLSGGPVAGGNGRETGGRGAEKKAGPGDSAEVCFVFLFGVEVFWIFILEMCGAEKSAMLWWIMFDLVWSSLI